ncbi:MAG: peptidylprolyl isomerase [Candidatus Omnitrophica bacterium]|nr:peptidylprolyl isomerase [Candidatus Omnitrophota bacterium]
MSPVVRRAACAVMISGIGLATAAAAPPARGAGETRNRIVAVVNSDVITAEDVAQAMAPLYKQFEETASAHERSSKVQEAEQRVVEILVNERLMLQEATAPRTFEIAKGKWATPTPITISGEELADALADVRAQFETEDEFLSVLHEHGMTLEDLKQRYRDQITIQKLVDREVRSRIAVSPSEITAYYERHLDQFQGAEAVRVSNLLIRVGDGVDDRQAKAKAEALRQAIHNGADFAETARRESQGPAAAEGGMIGWVERGRLMPEIEQAVFALAPGQLSPVVRSALGYHVFRLEERRAVQTKPLADVQSQIRDALSQERFQQRYREWIAKLRDRAYITIKTASASAPAS